MRWTRNAIFGVIAIIGATFVSPMIANRISSPTVSAADKDPEAGNLNQNRKATFPARFPNRVASQFAQSLNRQDFVATIAFFDPKFDQTLPLAKLKELWQALESAHGKFNIVRYQFAEPIGSLVLFRIEVASDSSYLSFRVDVNDEDRICGIWIKTDKTNSNQFSEFLFGSRIKEIVTSERKLLANAANLDGIPYHMINFVAYREVESDELPRSGDWLDANSNKSWRRFRGYGVSGGQSVEFGQLRPGLYRVIATSYDNSGTFRGISDPIRIGEQNTTKSNLFVPMQRGGNVRVSIVSDDSQPLKSIQVDFTRKDGLWPQFAAPPTEGDRPVQGNFPAGKYQITATAWSGDENDRRYELKDIVELDVVDGETHDVRVTLHGRNPTDAELYELTPWVITGRVTDPKGVPITGADIRARVSMEFRHTKTDANGRYIVRLPNWRCHGDKEDEEAPFHLNQVVLTASKPGMFEANLNRQGVLPASLRLPRPDEISSVPAFDQDRLLVAGKPGEVNFVLNPAIEVSVTMLDRQGNPIEGKQVNLNGKELPENARFIASGQTDKHGQISFRNIPTERKFWLEMNLGNFPIGRSQSIQFPASMRRCEVIVQHTLEEQTGFDLLNLVGLKDEQGGIAAKQIVLEDQDYLPPAAPAIQERGRGILQKARQVNRYWLDGPPAEIKKYRYDFQLHDNPPVSIQVNDLKTDSISKRRGITYDSAFDYLTAHPEKAIFRKVDVGAERIELVYALRDPIHVSAGFGSKLSNQFGGSHGWNGNYDWDIKDGTLIIDAKTNTLISHQSGLLNEELSDYVEIEAGHYVPLRIRTNLFMELDFQFAVHKPGLWLFNKSTYSADGVLKLHLNVNNVVIE